MAFWEYTLAGFSDFLEQRHIAFEVPMPASRVCSVCGRVPSSTVMLPCGHVSCEMCRGKFFEGSRCPFDGRAFMEGELVRLRVQLSDLESRRVFCLMGGNKCPTFSGKLSELRDHMRHCRNIGGQCAKCHRLVPNALAVDHSKQCRDGARPLVYDMPLQTAVQEIRRMKEDIEGLRQQALDAHDEGHDLANRANGLLERLSRIDRALSLVSETVVGVNRDGEGPEPLRKEEPTPGPYRAASKTGVFIATCVFTGVYAARDSLKEKRERVVLYTDSSTLGVYTFNLGCDFRLSGNEDAEEVDVEFGMFLEEGDGNDHVEWSFSKKVTMVIAHPRDESKDIRVPYDPHGDKSAKKSRPFDSNYRKITEKKSWKDLELQGFIVKDALYVNVEFE
ncbi:hypothetical protein HPB52_008625 [Rhipicephalus sanguineus]|uniref:RING-type domain-containing protein n=1 Tax=Rhipicephalus sanguineus TaxID=34632 RepID=A0A9D4QF97_RHISA|nr:hypothetical protein HPB52_008625 [Rhipicephalus sanguineus]